MTKPQYCQAILIKKAHHNSKIQTTQIYFNNK